MSSRELHWRVGDDEIPCRIEEGKDHGVFYIRDRALPFRFVDPTHIEIAGRIHRFYVIHNRKTSTVWLDGRVYTLERTQKTSAGGGSTRTGTGEVHAIMPGKLLRLDVAEGDSVTEKQTVAVMESMKMESGLMAPISGRVVEIRFKPGEVVEMGDVVMVIEKI